jgi:predicted nucleic acid-binding protein
LTRDASDAKFLELALAANADFLVTYDHRHLLRLKSIGRTRIVTPHKFLLALKKNSA